MENENKGGRNYSGCWILYTLIGSGAWIALIIAKACGVIRMNWPAVALGILWVPALLLGFVLGLVGVVALLRAAGRKLREWKRRQKIAWTLRESMEGLTLNSIGPVYGVRRQPGEKNRAYKRRILHAARTLDVVNVQNMPQPATGQKIDTIAEKHGLMRRKNETDGQLQNRIRKAAFAELEGGGKHDGV